MQSRCTHTLNWPAGRRASCKIWSRLLAFRSFRCSSPHTLRIAARAAAAPAPQATRRRCNLQLPPRCACFSAVSSLFAVAAMIHELSLLVLACVRARVCVRACTRGNQSVKVRAGDSSAACGSHISPKQAVRPAPHRPAALPRWLARIPVRSMAGETAARSGRAGNTRAVCQSPETSQRLSSNPRPRWPRRVQHELISARPRQAPAGARAASQPTPPVFATLLPPLPNRTRRPPMAARVCVRGAHLCPLFSAPHVSAGACMFGFPLRARQLVVRVCRTSSELMNAPALPETARRGAAARL